MTILEHPPTRTTPPFMALALGGAVYALVAFVSPYRRMRRRASIETSHRTGEA